MVTSPFAEGIGMLHSFGPKISAKIKASCYGITFMVMLIKIQIFLIQMLNDKYSLKSNFEKEEVNMIDLIRYDTTNHT